MYYIVITDQFLIYIATGVKCIGCKVKFLKKKYVRTFQQWFVYV